MPLLARYGRNLEIGKQIRRSPQLKRRNLLIAFAPDGKTVAAAGFDHDVTLSDVATGQERERLAGRRATVRSIAISLDGKTLASGSNDGTALVWDLAEDQRAIPAKVT